jgi:hypothetical protein
MEKTLRINSGRHGRDPQCILARSILNFKEINFADIFTKTLARSVQGAWKKDELDSHLRTEYCKLGGKGGMDSVSLLLLSPVIVLCYL